MSIGLEIQEIQEAMEVNEVGLKRRCQILRQESALKGISVDPSITMEIEDIEAYFVKVSKGV